MHVWICQILAFLWILTINQAVLMTLPSVWSVLPRSSEQLQWCCVTYGSHISTVHWEVPYRTFTSHSSQGCHIDSCKIAPCSAALKYEYLHIREEYLKIYDLVWCIIKVYGALPTLCIRPMPTLLHMYCMLKK